MKKTPLTFFLLLITLVFFYSFSGKKPVFNPESNVQDVLMSWGEKPPIHYLSNVDTLKSNMGEDLVKKGVTIGSDGKPNKRQSKHFVCTSCHNTVREEPNLTVIEPKGRLEYAIENDIPFLQGTTLHGIVNRETYYNGDYLNKYGTLVLPARDSLINAVKLCAVQCSQGRQFEDWELEAVMHYLWSLQFKLRDLDLTDEDYKKINSGKNETEWLKSKYTLASPATFKYPWKGMPKPAGENGDYDNGKAIYTNSCMHCHNPDGVTNFTLDLSQLDVGLLKRNLNNDNRFSLYWISRLGTKPVPGYKPYMPHYTAERMSDEQIEDLASFLKNYHE